MGRAVLVIYLHYFYCFLHQSSESDKDSKLSFGRMDDKESFLRLENKIQIWIFAVFLIYFHYTQILRELLWLLQISISLFIFLYTSFCTKTMSYISLYAINKKNTAAKDLYGVHTCTHRYTHTHTHTHTHNKYALNNLSEFHRFLPED